VPRAAPPASRFGLGQRQPRMVEEGATGSGQFGTVNTARQQRNANLVFQVADLPAQGWLRRVQPLFGGDRQAALLGDGDEVSKVPQLPRPISWRYGYQLTSLFPRRNE
jgi:hypothetical protein